MRFKKLAVSAAALAATLGALPASAADIIMAPPAAPVTRPVPAIISTPIKNWEGGYSGIAVSYGFSNPTTLRDKDDLRGFGGSVFAGYNWQAGSFVYGIDGDLGYNRLRLVSDEATVKGGFDGALRARLGYSVTDDLLVYAAAGGAAGRFTVAEPTSSETKTVIGWTAGGGLDARLTDTVFARAEYRYTSYTLRDGWDGKFGTSKVMLGLGMQF